MAPAPVRLSRRRLLAAGLLAVSGCGGGGGDDPQATRLLQPGDRWTYEVTQVAFQVPPGAAFIPGGALPGAVQETRQGTATLDVSASERDGRRVLWHVLSGDFAIDERREVQQDRGTRDVVTVAYGCAGDDPGCRQALEEPLLLLPSRWFPGERFLYPTVDRRPSEAYVRDRQTVETPSGRFEAWRVEVDTNSGTRYDYVVSMLFLVPSLGAWAVREDSRISGQTGTGTVTTFRLQETSIPLSG